MLTDGKRELDRIAFGRDLSSGAGTRGSGESDGVKTSVPKSLCVLCRRFKRSSTVYPASVLTRPPSFQEVG
jgi:hypothetical protein